MFRLLWKHKVFILFFVILIILLPQAVTRPAQMLSKTLLTSVGIDKTDGEYEISGERIINQFGKSAERKSEIVTETGPSIGAAFNKMSASAGREISLAHCTVLVVGAGLNDENLADILSYFFHKTELNNNCSIVYTADEVKKILDASLKGGDTRGGLLQQIMEFNQENVYGRPTSLEKFYKDYLRKGKTGLIPTAKLEEEKISNERQTAIFRCGRYTAMLDKTQTAALNFLNSKSTKVRQIVDDATLHVVSKSAKVTTKLTEGKPIVKVTCRTAVEIESLEGKLALNDISKAKSEEIKTALEQKLTNDLKNTFAEVSAQKADFMHLYDLFYRRHTKSFKNYMRNKTLDSFLSDIEFQVKADVTVIT